MSSRVRKTIPATKPPPQPKNGDVWQQRQMEKNRALIALVETWCEEDSERDPQEVEAEWAEFKKALDENRLSDRKF